jgi:SPP1 family predicted phage head-tail adaptor
VTAPAIDPGRFDKRVALISLIEAPDGAGGLTGQTEQVAVLWAMIEPAGAVSLRAADRDIENLTHRITIRHRAGVEAGMALAWGTRQFHIDTVSDPDEGKRYLVCQTRELRP